MVESFPGALPIRPRRNPSARSRTQANAGCPEVFFDVRERRDLLEIEALERLLFFHREPAAENGAIASPIHEASGIVAATPPDEPIPRSAVWSRSASPRMAPRRRSYLRQTTEHLSALPYWRGRSFRPLRPGFLAGSCDCLLYENPPGLAFRRSFASQVDLKLAFRRHPVRRASSGCRSRSPSPARTGARQAASDELEKAGNEGFACMRALDSHPPAWMRQFTHRGAGNRATGKGER